MSFSQLSLRRLRVAGPGPATVSLMERVPLRFRDGTPARGRAASPGPSIEIVRAHPRYVERAQRQGNQVHVWTVDAPEDVELCLELGVDAIITNRPRRVREAVRAQAPPKPGETAPTRRIRSCSSDRTWPSQSTPM